MGWETGWNTKYVQECHLLPARSCMPGGLGCVLGVSPCRPRAPLPSASSRCEMEGGGWGQEGFAPFTTSMVKMWVKDVYTAHSQALLNSALNNTKSGCRKISGRGFSSFPEFLTHGWLFCYSGATGKLIMGFGIPGLRIIVLLAPIYLSSLS